MRNLVFAILILSAASFAADASAPKPANAPAQKTPQKTAAPVPKSPRVETAARQTSTELLTKALAGPLKNVSEIVFVSRTVYNDPHWYANIGYYCDDAGKKAYAGNGKGDCGKLYKLKLADCATPGATPAPQVLLDAGTGSLRDPQLSYDGKTILFSWRKAETDCYHLYEIGIDGTGLKPLTSGEFDDIEPTYLPDGNILFVSTRCRRWVSCWMTQVATLHRCDGNGQNIRPVSCNIEHDNTPWVMPDGRILYTRWEYVDRSQVDFHALWTMFPDGSGQSIYYGNERPGIVMIDAKPIPGTDKVLASFSPGHGVNEHAGRLTILTPNKGPDDTSAARSIDLKTLIRDPYPLGDDFFLVAQANKIQLVDGSGNIQTLYTHSGPGNLHEPRPIVARPREPVLPGRSAEKTSTGAFLLANVYEGLGAPPYYGANGAQSATATRSAATVIKKLLVMEVLPKPVNFSGGMDLTSWSGTFNLERVLGTVPVEDDGSAYFEVPAQRPLFFVALDKDGLSVKRMQSFTTVMPGETLGCVGCHESRAMAGSAPHATAPGSYSAVFAARRAPSPIARFEGLPDIVDFNRDIQPVLDQHCVACHSPQKRDGRVLLNGDMGPHWSLSYFSLIASAQVADGRNALGNQPLRSIGSSASPLMKKLDGSHYNARPTEAQRRLVWMWLESGAPFAGTYAALRNAQGQQAGYGSAYQSVFGLEHDVLRRRCNTCHVASRDADNALVTHTPLPLPFNADHEARRKALGRPSLAHERIILPSDPMLCYASNILLNLTRPEASSLLLAPLAKSAGGWEVCKGAVFKDTNDPDYQRLLAGLRRGKAAIEAEHQFGTAAFAPNPQYIREMKRFGVLQPAFDPARDSIDVFATDEKYWELHWAK